MKKILFLLGFILFFVEFPKAQPDEKRPFPILPKDDFQFLEDLTKDVLESSRIYPGQTVPNNPGPNNTGGTLIRPGGRDCYPAFWIRDYAMSLESGLIPHEEQRHMLLLTASTQCDQAWITPGGSLVPFGAVADHVRLEDSLPIYFPGTYSYEEQGIPKFGTLPPISDQFFFIHMAHTYVASTARTAILQQEINGITLIQRLENAYKSAATRHDSPLVYTTEYFRGVDFGFRDVQVITGDLCFPSILKYRASLQLANLLEHTGQKGKAASYRETAQKLKELIPAVFSDSRGMLKASNGKSAQPDVWSTALAVYFGILEGEAREKTCRFLAEAYRNETLAYKGNIRHILTSDDYSSTTAWEISLAEKNTYQNGAYWGTPVGWVAFALSETDPEAARELVEAYIQELRENDFRKGPDYNAPWECFHPNGHQQNPVYLTSVSCPFAVFTKMLSNE